MKKFLSLIVSIAMLDTCLVGCNGSNSTYNNVYGIQSCIESAITDMENNGIEIPSCEIYSDSQYKQYNHTYDGEYFNFDELITNINQKLEEKNITGTWCASIKDNQNENILDNQITVTYAIDNISTDIYFLNNEGTMDNVLNSDNITFEEYMNFDKIDLKETIPNDDVMKILKTSVEEVFFDMKNEGIDTNIKLICSNSDFDNLLESKNFNSLDFEEKLKENLSQQYITLGNNWLISMNDDNSIDCIIYDTKKISNDDEISYVQTSKGFDVVICEEIGMSVGLGIKEEELENMFNKRIQSLFCEFLNISNVWNQYKNQSDGFEKTLQNTSLSQSQIDAFVDTIKLYNIEKTTRDDGSISCNAKYYVDFYLNWTVKDGYIQDISVMSNPFLQNNSLSDTEKSLDMSFLIAPINLENNYYQYSDLHSKFVEITAEESAIEETDAYIAYEYNDYINKYSFTYSNYYYILNIS